MREFVAGMALLGGGFAAWKRQPRVMALGLIPAAIVGIVLLSCLVALGMNLPRLTEAATPFADNWPGLWVTVVRITVGTAMVGAALVLIAVSFTALTLVVGEPFYDRIWRAVEADAGTSVPDADYGFWRSVGDGASLVLRGIGIAVLAALIGLVPLVGGFGGAVFGVTMTGWLIADELSSRALSARGLDGATRRRLLRAHRGRALGFGVATQLCFLVPLGAVATMPAAVAGSTALARSMLQSPIASVAAAPAARSAAGAGAGASD